MLSFLLLKKVPTKDVTYTDKYFQKKKSYNLKRQRLFKIWFQYAS